MFDIILSMNNSNKAGSSTVRHLLDANSSGNNYVVGLFKKGVRQIHGQSLMDDPCDQGLSEGISLMILHSMGTA